MTLHHSRVYADINFNRPRDDSDIYKFEVKWSTADLLIYEKLGKGTFGEVYKCRDTQNRRLCALKVLLKKHRILSFKREIMILESLQGCPNIIRYFGAIKELPNVGGPALVFQYVNPRGYNHFASHANTEDIRFYMLQLLRAIEVCHSKGIMHRDIKPENILLDTRRRCLYLIDFGHADYYFPGKEYSIRVCTRYYKGPELLINFKQYDYSLDMWSFGCVFAELIFNCQVFFFGHTNEDQLNKIARVLGTKAIIEYVVKTGVPMTPIIKDHIGNFARVSLKHFVNAHNQLTATPSALDLLKKLLVVNHWKRLSAVEAMSHPYFDDSHLSSSAC
nr:casein kinase ii subunit alpha [Hymenolepis microstoma]